MNDQQREALRRALNALKAAQRGDLDSQWNREAIADVEAALTQPQAQQAIKQDLTTEQQAAAVPAGFKLVAVKGFDDLMYWLHRCSEKGHLENCFDLVAPWESFEYQDVSYAPPAPVLPLSAWQPIEAAPKDGTNVLLTNGETVSQGVYEHHAPYVREIRDSDGRYIDQDEFDGFDGWIDFVGGMLPEPTHWQPLPAPPITAHGAGGE